MNRYFLWCIDANPYLVSFNTEYGYCDIVTNHQRFTYTTC